MLARLLRMILGLRDDEFALVIVAKYGEDRPSSVTEVLVSEREDKQQGERLVLVNGMVQYVSDHGIVVVQKVADPPPDRGRRVELARG